MDLLPAGKKARREIIAAGINCLLSTVMTTNNSGALPVNHRSMNARRGERSVNQNAGLASVVHDGDGRFDEGF